MNIIQLERMKRLMSDYIQFFADQKVKDLRIDIKYYPSESKIEHFDIISRNVFFRLRIFGIKWFFIYLKVYGIKG